MKSDKRQYDVRYKWNGKAMRQKMLQSPLLEWGEGGGVAGERGRWSTEANWLIIQNELQLRKLRVATGEQSQSQLEELNSMWVSCSACIFVSFRSGGVHLTLSAG